MEANQAAIKIEQARATFNEAIARETDPDKRARLEIGREYFTNADFRQKFEGFIWEQCQGEIKS